MGYFEGASEMVLLFEAQSAHIVKRCNPTEVIFKIWFGWIMPNVNKDFSLKVC